MRSLDMKKWVAGRGEPPEERESAQAEEAQAETEKTAVIAPTDILLRPRPEDPYDDPAAFNMRLPMGDF